MTEEIKIHCAHDRLVDVTELVANPRNPNKHSDEQVALLAKIIRHQGWRSPVVVSKRSGFIVAGHGRFEAGKLLGCQSVPCNFQDFETEADEWAHMVADNRIAELAETDDAELKALLGELAAQNVDMDLTGFDAESLGMFDALEVAPPELNSGDRAPFRQCTFTLHDEQFEQVEAALKAAKSQGGAESAVNENSNGNALAWICAKFIQG